MAEEPIIFAVGDDGGTARLIALLETLGMTGAEALERVASGYKNLSATTASVAAQTDILIQAAAAGFTNLNELAAAVERLTLSEQAYLAASGEVFASFERLATAASAAGTALAAYGEASLAGAAGSRELATAVTGTAVAIRSLAEQYGAIGALANEFASAQARVGQASSVIEGEFSVVTTALLGQTRAYTSATQAAIGYAGATGSVSAAMHSISSSGLDTASIYSKLKGEAEGLGTALTGVTARSGTLKDAFVGMGAATKQVISNFSGLIAQVGLFVTAAAAIHDLDALTRINQGLRLATGSAEGTAQAFNKLTAIALETQQPMEAVYRTFQQLSSVAKEQGQSTEVAMQATENIAVAFAKAGVTGALASRTIHELTEAISNGGHATQALNAIMRQSAVVAQILHDAFGIDINVMKEHTDTIGKASVALEKAQQDYKDLVNGTQNAASQIRALTSEQKSGQEQLDKLNNTMQGHIGSLATYKNDLISVKDATDKVNKSTGQYGATLPQLTAAARAQAAVEKDVAKQRIENAQMALNAAKEQSTAFSLQAFASAKAAAALAQLPPVQQTISGALENLNTRLLAYINSTGQANVVIAAFNAALNAIGVLLPVITPAIFALGAAWATVKIATIVKDFGALANAMRVLITVNPLVTAGFAALVAIALYFFNHTEAGAAVVTKLKQEIQSLSLAIMESAQAHDKATASTIAHNGAQQSLLLSVTNLTQEQLQQLQAMRNVGASYDQISAQAKRYQQENAGVAQSSSRVADAAGAISEGVKEVTTSMQAAGAASTDFGNKATSATTSVSGGFRSLGQEIENAIGNALSSAASKIASWASQALGYIKGVLAGIAGVSGATTKPSAPAAAAPSAVPAARSGASFTVAGSSGTDTVPLWVSPGEHVTVQTPMQRRMGVVPSNRPADRHFADGGIFAPTTGGGVSLGLAGISVSLAAPGTGVTGYQAEALKTANDNIEATNNNTSATADNTDAISTAISGAGTTSVSPVSMDAGYVMPSISTGSALANAVVSASSAPPNPLPSVPRAGPSATTVDTAAGQETLAINSARTAAINSQQEQFMADNIERYKRQYYAFKIGGVQVKDPQGRDLLTKDGLTGVTQATIDTEVARLQRQLDTLKTQHTEQAAIYQATSGGHMYGFRDGGDMYVGGSSGVDSRMIPLAVSPGESVHVRTPQQRREAATDNNVGMNRQPIINQTIITPDANSFGRSQHQIARQQLQAQRRIARSM